VDLKRLKAEIHRLVIDLALLPGFDDLRKRAAGHAGASAPAASRSPSAGEPKARTRGPEE